MNMPMPHVPKTCRRFSCCTDSPSSSRMFEPSSPGFGIAITFAPITRLRTQRLTGPYKIAYTLDHDAENMNRFTETRRLLRYTLNIQDYGGPEGFRMALAHPDRIEALIVQDAVAACHRSGSPLSAAVHNEGLTSEARQSSDHRTG